MNAIAVPALLTDNDVLRTCLRERDAVAAAPEPVLCFHQWVRPAAVQRVQAALPVEQALLGNPDEWPEPLQQLYWELSASTSLRPLANLMGKGALLPDPWNLQGGVQAAGSMTVECLPQHPRTRLYTVLRLLVLLRGEATLSTAGQAWPLVAGDALVWEAALPVQRESSDDACWLACCFYAPDPCCCRSAAAKGVSA